MKNKMYKKVLFVITIILSLFILNDGKVMGFNTGEVICSYPVTDGNIEVVQKEKNCITNENTSEIYCEPYYEWSYTNPHGTGSESDPYYHAVDLSGSSTKYNSGVLDKTYYDFSSGICPEIYAKVVEENVGYYLKEIQIAPDEKTINDRSEGSGGRGINPIYSTINNGCDSKLIYKVETKYKSMSNLYSSLEQIVSKTNNISCGHFTQRDVDKATNQLKIIDKEWNNTFNNFISTNTDYDKLYNQYLDQVKVCGMDSKFITAKGFLDKVDKLRISYDQAQRDFDNNCTAVVAKEASYDERGQETVEKIEEFEEYQREQRKERERLMKSAYSALNQGGSISGDGTLDCHSLIGAHVYDDIVEILNWIRIAGPILVIVLGSLDFGKAVISDDDQALKKATAKFTKRMIAAIALFFAPLILKYLLDFAESVADNFNGGCDVTKL